MDLRNRIVDLISESGHGLKEKTKTIYTMCPVCQKDDKFSILKTSGSCICYRGTCTFGKRGFVDWVELTFGISSKEAYAKVFGREYAPKEEFRTRWSLKIPKPIDEDLSPTEKLLTGLKDMKWPEFHMVPIESAEGAPAAEYLAGRGIPLDVATRYDITFSKTYRRVYFPVKMSGKYYGYQGRHIDKVEDKLKVRNNEGFARETLIMFADQLDGSDFAIVSEGPVDAIKFDLIGGNVCTMGKVVTQKQLDIILSYGITKLYLALDDDALYETNMLAEGSKLETYQVKVPQSCKERCALIGKKADFGECTFEEAKQAFENAAPLQAKNERAWVPYED